MFNPIELPLPFAFKGIPYKAVLAYNERVQQFHVVATCRVSLAIKSICDPTTSFYTTNKPLDIYLEDTYPELLL